jgi:hypothetical protein
MQPGLQAEEERRLGAGDRMTLDEPLFADAVLASYRRAAASHAAESLAAESLAAESPADESLAAATDD